MSDLIRLDPATLREAARWVSMLEPNTDDGPARLAWARLTVTIGHLLHGAAQAAEMPLRLSDWVRACETTKLGAFTLGQTANGIGFFFGEDGHEWVVDFHHDLTMARVQKVDGCEAYTFGRPAELVTMLDTLAEEAHE